MDISTQNGRMKNVQYGISRPLGSREIQETEVDTVMRDTLYFGGLHAISLSIIASFCCGGQITSVSCRATTKNWPWMDGRWCCNKAVYLYLGKQAF